MRICIHMSLTICTVVYNEEKNLSTIEHNIRVLRESAPSLQFLLIDNGSNDGSNEGLKKLTAQFGIEHLVRSKNHLPQARQQALTTAKTQWVGFVDADCRIDERWVYCIQKRLLQNSAKTVAIGGPWTITGGDAPVYQGLFNYLP